MMSDKPKTLLMKPWEPKAILSGATMFVRPAKGVPAQPKTNCHPDHKQKHPEPYLDSYCGERKTDINPRGMSEFWNWWQVDDRQCLPQFKCPYGQPGTCIIGKETWYARRSEPIVVEGCAVASGGPTEIYYSADDPEKHGGCWRSPATMPAWAARIHLEVASVECRRIQSVTEAEALACGFDNDTCAQIFWPQASKVDTAFERWLRSDDEDFDERYCRECAEEAVKKHPGAEVDGWDDAFDSDGARFCDTCGILLHHSLTRHGVETELGLTDEPETAVRHFPATGAQAKILWEMVTGMGDWNRDDDEYAGRLAQIGFATACNETHPGAWDSNDWFWFVSFKRIELTQ